MGHLQGAETALSHKHLIDCSASLHWLNLMRGQSLLHFAFVANQKDEFLADRYEQASFQS